MSNFKSIRASRRSDNGVISRCFVTVLAVVCALFALTSCKSGAVDGETEYFGVLSGINVIYKDGMFTFENGLLSYLSFETEKIVPVCYKPNCTHDEESGCPALISGVGTMFVCGDSLYTFELGYGWDKNRGETVITTTLFASSVSGTDKHKVAEIEGCSVHDGAYVKDGRAYFTASEVEFDESGSSTGYTKEYLYVCDLSDGSVERLLELADGHNAASDIEGCFDGRLVLQHNDCSDTAADYAKRKYSFFDPETGDITPIDGMVVRAQKDYLILKKGDTLEISPAGSDKPYVITDQRYVNPEWGGYAVADGRLILSADGIAMDLETKKEYNTFVCTLIARYNGGFMVRTPKREYRYVSDKEFYLGEAD